MKFLYPVGGVEDAPGIITAPNHGGVVAGIKAGLPWAVDAGCLEGPPYVKRVDFPELFEWLRLVRPYRQRCLFVAAGDIVGDAVATLETYEEFARYFLSAGWPFAYVAQNGAESLPIPETAGAVFIGGDTEWKESMAAVSVIRRAQAMGKHIHIGRVNWRRRYELFRVLSGSEDFTCDGTRTRFDGVDKTIAAWEGYMAQPPLVTI